MKKLKMGREIHPEFIILIPMIIFWTYLLIKIANNVS
jgi:hypothetical protein